MRARTIHELVTDVILWPFFLAFLVNILSNAQKVGGLPQFQYSNSRLKKVVKISAAP